MGALNLNDAQTEERAVRGYKLTCGRYQARPIELEKRFLIMSLRFSEIVDSNLKLATAVTDFVGTNTEYLLTLLIGSPGIFLDCVINAVGGSDSEYGYQRYQKGDKYETKQLDPLGGVIRSLIKYKDSTDVSYANPNAYWYYDRGLDDNDKRDNFLTCYRGGFFSKYPMNILAKPVAAVVSGVLSAATFVTMAAVLTAANIALLLFSAALFLTRSIFVGPAQAYTEIQTASELAFKPCKP